MGLASTLLLLASFGGAHQHALLRWEPNASLAAGEHWSTPPVDRRAAPFHEALPSWNIEAPRESGFRVELQVGQQREHGPSPVWSPWLRLEDRPPRGGTPQRGRREFDGGRVDVDLFRSAASYPWARLRVLSTGPPTGAPIRVASVSLCLTRRGAERRPRSAPEPALQAVARLPVPFRSQRTLGLELSDSICSPASVAMVLAYRGVEVPTREVVDAVFDPLHGIWGNWPRNVQGAFELGVPGYLTRVSTWAEVADHLERGQPLVASIAVAEGQLRGAPYPSTTGHLLCVVGLDERGDVLVSDPAAETAAGGELTYAREELERAWFDRGGTAYVLLPTESPGPGNAGR